MMLGPPLGACPTSHGAGCRVAARSDEGADGSGRQIGVGPGADDASGALSLVATCQEMVGTLERHEAAWVPCGSEDLAGVVDAHGVVSRRMHDQKCSSQGADLVVQVDRAHVLDEVPSKNEGLAANEKRRL